LRIPENFSSPLHFISGLFVILASPILQTRPISKLSSVTPPPLFLKFTYLLLRRRYLVRSLDYKSTKPRHQPSDRRLALRAFAEGFGIYTLFNFKSSMAIIAAFPNRPIFVDRHFSFPVTLVQAPSERNIYYISLFIFIPRQANY
jgi:hypothetical protein